METCQHLESLLVKNNSDFEMFYKNYLNGNFEEKEISLELNDALSRSVNSLKYWGPKMKKFESDSMVMLSTFSVSPIFNVSFVEMFQSLKEVIDLRKVKNVFFPENRRYLGIQCYNKEDIEIIRQHFKKVKNCYVIYVSWLGEEKTVEGRVHWMPMVEPEIVEDFLSKFMKIEELKRTKIALDEGVLVESNVIEFKGVLKKPFTSDNVPHITEIGKNRALITIKRRKPICINCMQIGHIKSECSYVYCKVCKIKCFKKHFCSNFADNVTRSEVMKVNAKELADKVGQVSKSGAEEESDAKSEDGWLTVNRNFGKSYGRNTLNLSENWGDLVNEKKVSFEKSDILEAKEKTEQSGNNETKEEMLSLEKKTGIVKRKHEVDSFGDDQKSEKIMMVEKNNEDVESKIEVSNVYSILDSDFSES